MSFEIIEIETENTELKEAEIRIRRTFEQEAKNSLAKAYRVSVRSLQPEGRVLWIVSSVDNLEEAAKVFNNYLNHCCEEGYHLHIEPALESLRTNRWTVVAD